MLTRTALLRLFCCFLLVMSGASAGVDLASATPTTLPDSAESNATTTSNGPAPTEVIQTVTYRLRPQSDDYVEIEVSYELGSAVTQLTTNLAKPTSVKPFTDHPGFVAGGDREQTLRWDGSTRTPSVTLLSVVSRIDDTGGISGAARAEWALFSTNTFSTGFAVRGGTGTPTLTERYRVEGEGYATDDYIFLGDNEAQTFSVEDHDVRFVIPNRSKLNQTHAQHTQETLTHAAETYRPSSGAETITLFTATPPIRRGGQASGDSMWVHQQTLRASNGQSILVHEYVHTQQDFFPACEMDWLVEGSAEYYGHLIPTLRGKPIETGPKHVRSDSAYQQFYREVSRDNHGTASLTASCEWSKLHYDRGERVLAALDAHIRTTTDGERTLQDVMVSVNDHEGKLTFDDFTRIVSETAGEPMDGWLDRHVVDGVAPTVPKDPSLYFGPDADNDGDGLTREEEAALGTDLDVADTDGDRLPDGKEVDLGTDPLAKDTDGDGLRDWEEVNLGSDPTVVDTDGDGLTDDQEVNAQFRPTDPTVADTDGDGLVDGEEHPPDGESISDATIADTDGDGLSDPDELDRGTHPWRRDTDGDGVSDGEEVASGTDPLRKTIHWGRLADDVARMTDRVVSDLIEWASHQLSKSLYSAR